MRSMARLSARVASTGASFVLAGAALLMATPAAHANSTVSSTMNTSSASQSNVAAAVPSCRDFWRHSGHTDRVRWYHCHRTSDPYVKRVHICGVSGTLHGITVAQFPDGVWLRNSSTHRHDVGGEGC